MLEIGKNIKKLRELRNYTQDYMAEQLEMSQNGYGKIELGKTDVPFSRLEQIAKILSVTVGQIMEFDEKKMVFEISNNTNTNGINNLAIYQGLDEQQRKLYEDLIESLKREVSYLKEMCDLYKSKAL